MASVSIILPQSKRAQCPCMCVELHQRLDRAHPKAARSDSSLFLVQVHLQIPFHNKTPCMLTELLTRMLTGMLAGVSSRVLNTSSSTMRVDDEKHRMVHRLWKSFSASQKVGESFVFLTPPVTPSGSREGSHVAENQLQFGVSPTHWPGRCTPF